MEAPGGEEMEAMTPYDEVMCHEKVTRRLQCDRLGSEDTTQVEVTWSSGAQMSGDKRDGGKEGGGSRG